jgi:hypothetical protein
MGEMCKNVIRVKLVFWTIIVATDQPNPLIIMIFFQQIVAVRKEGWGRHAIVFQDYDTILLFYCPIHRSEWPGPATKIMIHVLAP